MTNKITNKSTETQEKHIYENCDFQEAFDIVFKRIEKLEKELLDKDIKIHNLEVAINEKGEKIINLEKTNTKLEERLNSLETIPEWYINLVQRISIIQTNMNDMMRKIEEVENETKIQLTKKTDAIYNYYNDFIQRKLNETNYCMRLLIEKSTNEKNAEIEFIENEIHSLKNGLRDIQIRFKAGVEKYEEMFHSITTKVENCEKETNNKLQILEIQQTREHDKLERLNYKMLINGNTEERRDYLLNCLRSSLQEEVNIYNEIKRIRLLPIEATEQKNISNFYCVIYHKTKPDNVWYFINNFTTTQKINNLFQSQNSNYDFNVLNLFRRHKNMNFEEEKNNYNKYVGYSFPNSIQRTIKLKYDYNDKIVTNNSENYNRYHNGIAKGFYLNKRSCLCFIKIPSGNELVETTIQPQEIYKRTFAKPQEEKPELIKNIELEYEIEELENLLLESLERTECLKLILNNQFNINEC